MPRETTAEWLANRRRKWHRRLTVLGVATALLAVLCFFAFNETLMTRRYQVTSPKLSGQEPIRVVVLSDLHNHVYGADQSPLVERIAALAPDIICLVGDIADDILPIRGTELLLSGIAGLAPCYYVTGNHEYWGNWPPMLETIAAHGVTILRGEGKSVTVRGQQVNLWGLDDPYYTRPGDYGPLLIPFAEIPKDEYNILLCHRPDPIGLISEYGFDLVLSGHAHGGQVRIPGLVNGLYAPDQGWFPAYAGGLYRVAETDLVVSRGLSYYDELPRIFNPPEVVLVALAGGEG